MIDEYSLFNILLFCSQQNGKICDGCRNKFYGASKDQLKNMCKGSDAATAMDQKLMQCAMEESAKAGNPVKTLTPNPDFASHSASCAQKGLTV